MHYQNIGYIILLLGSITLISLQAVQADRLMIVQQPIGADIIQSDPPPALFDQNETTKERRPINSLKTLAFRKYTHTHTPPPLKPFSYLPCSTTSLNWSLISACLPIICAAASCAPGLYCLTSTAQPLLFLANSAIVAGQYLICVACWNMHRRECEIHLENRAIKKIQKLPDYGLLKTIYESLDEAERASTLPEWKRILDQ